MCNRGHCSTHRNLTYLFSRSSHAKDFHSTTAMNEKANRNVLKGRTTREKKSERNYVKQYCFPCFSNALCRAQVRIGPFESVPVKNKPKANFINLNSNCKTFMMDELKMNIPNMVCIIICHICEAFICIIDIGTSQSVFK